jgi:hypothetical protein
MAREKGKPGRPAARPTQADDTSWAPGRKGQGGEGYSKGYGGSRGAGTGSAGPESRTGRLRSKAPAPKKTKARR